MGNSSPGTPTLQSDGKYHGIASQSVATCRFNHEIAKFARNGHNLRIQAQIYSLADKFILPGFEDLFARGGSKRNRATQWNMFGFGHHVLAELEFTYGVGGGWLGFQQNMRNTQLRSVCGGRYAARAGPNDDDFELFDQLVHVEPDLKHKYA
jgi:hypothetical protein